MPNFRASWGQSTFWRICFSSAYLGESRQQQYMHAETGKEEKPDTLQVSSDSKKSFKDQSKTQNYFSKLSFKHSYVLRHLGSLKAKPVYQNHCSQHSFQNCIVTAVLSPRKVYAHG